MRTDKNTSVKLRLEYKELEANVKEQSAQLPKIAVNLAKDQALSQQPSVDAKSGSRYIRKLRNAAQGIITYIKSMLQVDLVKHETNNRLYVEKELAINTDIEQTDHEIGLAKRKVEKAADEGKHLALPKKNRFFWVRLACILFISADFFFSSSALQKLGVSKFASFFMGAGVAGAIMIAAEATPFVVERLQGRTKRIMALLGMIIFLTLIFYGIAYLRTSGTGNSGVPRFAFVALNLLLAIASMYLIWRNKPNKKEMEDLDEYLELEMETKQLESRKKQLQDDLFTLIKERQERMEMERVIRVYGADIEEQVNAAYQSAYADYCETNCMSRIDLKGQTPAFMESDPEALSFNFKNQ